MTVFTKNELESLIIPEDLGILIKKIECCQEMLEQMECRFFEKDEDIDLLSHSYLNEEDKKNKDIMANVSAIDDVFKHITFVMETTNGDLVGYWHGPEKIDIAESPVVLYDTEGQFSILNGANISEALVGNYVFDEDDDFLEFQKQFKTCGIQIATKWDELPEPKPETLPNKLHEKLYVEYLAK